ncbi:MAG: hypothetical protein IJW29_06350 [Clostridia bacterium]|nr:hypothetical protein [Clostridia bacterium]
MSQLSIFDALCEESHATDKLFDEGDKVWRVRLDIVDELTVTGTFEVSDRHADGEKTMRYHTKSESGGGGCFGKYDMGLTHFFSYEEARAVADANLASGEFWWIRAEEIEPIEFKAWEEPEPSDGRRNPLYACCALVKVGDTFCVYRRSAYSYHFMVEYQSEAEARSAYKKELAEVKSNAISNSGGCHDWDGEPKWPEAELKLRDVYGKGDGKWAHPDYARNQWLNRRR